MVKVLSPMVIAPVRWLGPGLGATVKPTVPGAVPEAPEVTVTKGALLTAVHPQFPVHVTPTMPGLPAAEKFWFGLRLNVCTVNMAGTEISPPQALERTTS